MLYRIARRLTRDPSRAEDLLQETYLRALRARDTFDLQTHGIRPWLLRIMHNLHFSQSDRERRQPTSMQDDQLDGSSAGIDLGMPPLTAASFEGMDERLVKAVEQLPVEYQSVLLLWAIDEL